MQSLQVDADRNKEAGAIADCRIDIDQGRPLAARSAMHRAIVADKKELRKLPPIRLCPLLGARCRVGFHTVRAKVVEFSDGEIAHTALSRGSLI